MKKKYKCSCCDCWYDEKDLDHISYSTDDIGSPKQYIQCKNCKKEGCLGLCKYMSNMEDKTLKQKEREG